MKNKDIIKTLQKEIEIPDIVQKKADAAFAAIRREAGNSRSGSPMVNHPADGEEEKGDTQASRKEDMDCSGSGGAGRGHNHGSGRLYETQQKPYRGHAGHRPAADTDAGKAPVIHSEPVLYGSGDYGNGSGQHNGQLLHPHCLPGGGI